MTRALGQGPRNLITDVAGLAVGNADDERLKSGVTVLLADRPLTAAVQVMGGAPGTRETDLLAPDRLVQAVDAIVLSGGSAFGLDAASGVMDALAARGRGFAVGPARVPIVPAAILFDLLNGGRKDWAVNPYRALGVAALDAASAEFALGSAGAGTGALTARLKGGLGSASAILPEGFTVGALVAANPVGCVTPPGQRRFWAAPFEMAGEFGSLGQPDPSPPLTVSDTKLALAADPGASTTIAIVATDAALSKAGALRLATAAHDGIARAIQPSHTPFDGDLVFAVATGTAREPAPADLAMLGHAAATCLARAIARAIWLARPAPGDARPTFRAGPV
jgi:D-aminopeptidase